MGRIVFITGTDTGIGKTTIAVQMIAGLRRSGLQVSALKPVETGCLVSESGDLVAQDGEALGSALGLPNPQETVVYKYRSPVSPVVAAAIEQKSIDTKLICGVIAERAARCDVLIVEGAGGLLVPLTYHYTFADLVAEMSMETVVVVGSKLGAINHSCLTFEALKARQLNVIGYVFNDMFVGDESAFQARGGVVSAQETNRELLIELSKRYGYLEVCYFPPLTDVTLNLDNPVSKVLQDDLAQCVLTHDN